MVAQDPSHSGMAPFGCPTNKKISREEAASLEQKIRSAVGAPESFLSCVPAYVCNRQLCFKVKDGSPLNVYDWKELLWDKTKANNLKVRRGRPGLSSTPEPWTCCARRPRSRHTLGSPVEGLSRSRPLQHDRSLDNPARMAGIGLSRASPRPRCRCRASWRRRAPRLGARIYDFAEEGLESFGGSNEASGLQKKVLEGEEPQIRGEEKDLQAHTWYGLSFGVAQPPKV